MIKEKLKKDLTLMIAIIKDIPFETVEKDVNDGKYIDDIFNYIKNYEVRKEEIMEKNVASVNYDSCIECQSCIGNCPVQAIFMTDKGHAKVSYKDCINCGGCIDSCPVGAISSITIELK